MTGAHLGHCAHHLMHYVHPALLSIGFFIFAILAECKQFSFKSTEEKNNFMYATIGVGFFFGFMACWKERNNIYASWKETRNSNDEISNTNKKKYDADERVRLSNTNTKKYNEGLVSSPV